ncbi:hypothetical protein LZZ85_07695, partial [Terrimonas sp. NA20]
TPCPSGKKCKRTLQRPSKKKPLPARQPAARSACNENIRPSSMTALTPSTETLFLQNKITLQ